MDQAVLEVAVKAKNEAGKALGEVERSIGSFDDKLKKVSGGVSKAGKNLTTRLTLPIVAFGALSLKAADEFNQGMANVATLIPGNTERVNELKGAVQNMSMEFGKSTTDLTNGLYQTISAFGDTNDSLKILEINSKAAVAGLAETTDAINLTSAVTKGYGDVSAKAVQQASDLALLTVRLGQTTFPELAASIGRVTPLAASLNVTQQELFGTMATFTGVTGKAAEVSTQLRGVLQAFMAPTADAARVISDLGFESGAAMLKGLGLQGSIEALTDASEKSGKPLQAYIGSIEGQTLALAATGGQADTYTEKIKAMGDAVGVTDEAFTEATGGINKAGFEAAQARQEFAVMQQEIGDMLAPVLVELAGIVKDAVGWFRELTPQQQEFILKAAGMVAILGPVLITLAKMIESFRIIKGAMAFFIADFKLATSESGTLNRSLGKFVGPAGSMALLGGAAIAAAIIVIGEFAKMRQEVDRMNKAVQTNRQSIADMVADAKADFDQGIIDANNYRKKLKIAAEAAADDVREVQRRNKDLGQFWQFDWLGEARAGDFFTFDLKNLFKAKGGPVRAGQPYVVGEQGPEWFVPKTAGEVVSNRDAAKGDMGRPNINITNNNYFTRDSDPLAFARRQAFELSRP